MPKRSKTSPPTNIRPRQLSNVAMLGLVALLLLTCILLRRDIFTDWGPAVWWGVSVTCAFIAGLLLHRILFPTPLVLVSHDHIAFPRALSKPIKWSLIKRIEVVSDRAGLKDVKDRLILHLKRPAKIDWRAKKIRDKIGLSQQTSVSIDVDHAWPCRAAQDSRTSGRTTFMPKLAMGGIMAAILMLPVLSHATGFGLPRVFSKGMGHYQSGDIVAALPHLRNDARAGDPEAAYVLGLLYSNGDGVDRNLSMALGWFQRAATHGSEDAGFQLGNAYRLGLGTPQDIKKAIMWYTRAADDGIPQAAHALSRIYRIGDGVRRDYATAIHWLENAASHSYAPAYHELGRLHLEGIGISKDPNRAAHYFELAADKGHIPARFDLAKLLLRGGPKDKAMGADQLRSVAESGFAPAQRRLSQQLHSGRNFSRDLIKSYKWITLAVRSWPENGRSELVNELLGIERALTPEQLAAAKAEIRAWKPSSL
jgi:TPR repeat protein